jgi:hypothetical protein
MSKIVQLVAFSLWSESPTLPFVRHNVKRKRLPAVKKLSIRGVEQAFRPAVKETLKLTLPRAARRVLLA